MRKLIAGAPLALIVSAISTQGVLDRPKGDVSAREPSQR
jgi:hypothetical protein